MHIIIHHSSMIPIYEQIIDQVKARIVSGELTAGTALPSVRTLSKELKISALTVKKAYDVLEESGYTVTVHGKGSYVAEVGDAQILEEQRRAVEDMLDAAVKKARQCGIADEEVTQLIALILSDPGR